LFNLTNEKENIIDLINFLFEKRIKKEALSFLQSSISQPIVHTSRMFKLENFCTSIVVPLCMHPKNNNSIICYDLRYDPTNLLQMTALEILEIWKGKDKIKDKPFVWKVERQLMLMRLCKEFHTKNGYNQPFDWMVITKDIEKLTGTKMAKDCARNKYEHMKKLWKAWSDLRFKVTGTGWDQSTGRVTLDDEWWDRLKKVNIFNVLCHS